MNFSKSKNTLLFKINNRNNYLNSSNEIKSNINIKNIIIDLNEFNFDEIFDDLNNLFTESKNNNRSFVIIKSDYRSEYQSLKMNIVPSLKEAIDIIEIEEIERDLGL
ncbi:MAG: ribonuclease Z [Flavobacteriaceae bacterium]|nr:ribonuclease Z [Flavobacteriaceae bacterium]